MTFNVRAVFELKIIGTQHESNIIELCARDGLRSSDDHDADAAAVSYRHLLDQIENHDDGPLVRRSTVGTLNHDGEAAKFARIKDDVSLIRSTTVGAGSNA